MDPMATESQDLPGLEPAAAPEPQVPEGRGRLLPFAFAKRHGILIVHFKDERGFAVCRPGVKPVSFAETRRFARVPLDITEVTEEEFDRRLREAYESGSNAAMQMVEGLDSDQNLSRVAQELPEPSDLLESEDDAPIIRLINAILTEAVKENASDIHIEPFENRLVVRFRVDGVLREVLQSRRAVAPLVVSRIKVMSRLDIAEKRVPQDGRISLKVAGRAVDVRVSTIPSGHGERVVMRLLDKQAGRLDLSSLGMDPGTEAMMDRLIHKPHGIILVTGPTGSGKTTTLYTALSALNTPERKIITVEDPVEDQLEGINQIQAKSSIGLDFAHALRSIVRQDPDVIMSGEMRDLETAKIAIQSALTGHLVLSTVHTNDAASGITRMLDMGVEDYLLTSTVNAILAQRLVRTLHPDHREAVRLLPEVAEEIGFTRLVEQDEYTVYRPVSSPENPGGYFGRTSIMELLPMSDPLRRMVMQHATAGELQKRAVSEGMRTMYQDGLLKCLRGVTSVEEVLRVTQEA
jgi:general secretion pathway protein E